MALLSCGPGSRDDPAAVLQNRGRVQGPSRRARAPLERASGARHGCDRGEHCLATTVSGPARTQSSRSPPGIAVSALTADCAPVLFRRAGRTRGRRRARRLARRFGGHLGSNRCDHGRIEEPNAITSPRRSAPRSGPQPTRWGWSSGDAFWTAIVPAHPLHSARPRRACVPILTCRAMSLIGLRRIRIARGPAPMPCTFAREAVLFSYRRSGRQGDGRLRPPNIRHRLDLTRRFPQL